MHKSFKRIHILHVKPCYNIFYSGIFPHMLPVLRVMDFLYDSDEIIEFQKNS